MADTEGKVHKGGQNREYQITERPPDPPPMRPLAPGSIVVVPRDAVVAGVAVPLPERAGREGDQPLPTQGAESVLASLEERVPALEAAGAVAPGTSARVLPRERARIAIGVKRYGRELETFNGRDAHEDLVCELLDGVNYAEQARLQYVALEARLAHALEQLKATDAQRLAALARAEKAEADLVSHVEAQDRRIAALRAQLDTGGSAR